MEARLNLAGSTLAARFGKHLVSARKELLESTLPAATQNLVTLRASQINGCAWCADMHSKDALHAGETPARLNLVATWRESTVFTDAERAALELTEQGTRIADASGGVTDEAWANAAQHYDEEQLGRPRLRHRPDQRLQPRERHRPAARRRLRTRPARIAGAGSDPVTRARRRGHLRQPSPTTKEHHMRVLTTTGDGTATPVDAPIPVPASDEVLVRVEAATINYVDRFISSGAAHRLGLITHDDPVGLGWDAVGRVEAVGSEVRTLAIGDRVAGVRVADDSIYGAIAEHVTLPEADVAQVPDTLTLDPGRSHRHERPDRRPGPRTVRRRR